MIDLTADLLRATDPEVMARSFSAFFKREYPGRGLKVSQCQVDRVYRKPGKKCTITYRVQGNDDAAQSFDNWFYGKISATGEGNDKELPEEWPGCGFWKPVSQWPEMNMVLYAFPYDRRLPYLGQLLEPEFVKRRVEQSLPRFGLSDELKCREATCERIKYRVGKRCVLRYKLLMVDAVGKPQSRVFYGKTYDDAKSRYVYEALQKICASEVCKSSPLNIPAPILHVDGANTLWQEAWEGERLVSAGKEFGWANLPGSGFLPKIAAMLAALQRMELTDPPLELGPGPKEVLKNAFEDTANILQFAPEQQQRLTRITKALIRFAPAVDERIPHTTIHGTFKIAQILCRDGQLALVDFDSIAYGDPLYDVAEFIASLVFLVVSDGIPAAPLTESAQLFLSSYQKQVFWICDRRRLAWYVVVFLLGKIHSILKKLNTEEIANITSGFALVEEWLAIVEAEGVNHDRSQSHERASAGGDQSL
jgi:hypothetical protein